MPAKDWQARKNTIRLIYANPKEDCSSLEFYDIMLEGRRDAQVLIGAEKYERSVAVEKATQDKRTSCKLQVLMLQYKGFVNRVIVGQATLLVRNVDKPACKRIQADEID